MFDEDVIPRPRVTVVPTRFASGAPAWTATCEHCPEWKAGRSVKTYMQAVATSHRAEHRAGRISLTAAASACDPAPVDRPDQRTSRSRKPLESRADRVRRAVSQARSSLRVALVAQARSLPAREEHARTQALNAALSLMDAIGQPVTDGTQPLGRFISPMGATATRAGTASEMTDISLTHREVANLRAALDARKTVLALDPRPDCELDVQALIRIEERIQVAAGPRGPVDVTTAPQIDWLDALVAAAAHHERYGDHPGEDPWADVADRLSDTVHAEGLRRFVDRLRTCLPAVRAGVR